MDEQRNRIGTRFARNAGIAAGVALVACLATAYGTPTVNSRGGVFDVPIADAVSSGNVVTDEVMAFFAHADPTLIADYSCARPANRFPVAYTPDRVIVRTTTPTPTRTAINANLDALIPGPNPSGGWIASTRTVTFPAPPAGGAITPVISFTLKPRPGGEDHPIVPLARALREGSIKASPDYALAPSMGFVKFWPAGAPTPAPALAPQRALTTGGGQPLGTGVRVDLYDTGLAPTTATPYLAQTAKLLPADGEKPDADLDGYVDYPHAGHGVAMSGVIATLAPGAGIRVGRISSPTGLATDFSAVLRMAKTLNTTAVAGWPDVVVHAFGSTACDLVANQPTNDPTGLQPLSLEAFTEAVARFAPTKPDGMVLVASAGNRSSTERTYPAAFNADPALAPGVVSVGAVDASVANDGDASEWFTASRSAPVSDYSNTGSWVETFAPGDHLATTHVKNLTWLEDPGEPPNDLIVGRAFVDGTSFSAPYVAAMIAEVMSTSGLRAVAAWNQIRSRGLAPTPPCDGSTRNLGTGVAVGVVSISSTALTPGSGGAPQC